MNTNKQYQRFDSLTENLAQLEIMGKLLKVKDVLGTNASDFSIIRWQSPKESSPEDGTYIILKQYAEESGFICSEAAYENEQYWPLFPASDIPYTPSTIAGWAYFSYDFRVNSIGEVVNP